MAESIDNILNESSENRNLRNKDRDLRNSQQIKELNKSYENAPDTPQFERFSIEDIDNITGPKNDIVSDPNFIHNAGQIDVKCSAITGLTVNIYKSIILFYNPKNRS